MRPETPLPPHNIEAEQMLLGFLLAGGELGDSSAYLETAMFSEQVHRDIHEAILRLKADGTSADPVTLKRLFERDGRLEAVGGSRYLASLLSHAVTVLDPDSYAREIYNSASLRKILSACQSAISAMDDGTPAEQIAGELNAVSGEILGKQESLRIQTDSQVAQSIEADMKAGRHVFSTGLPMLDEAMGGGLFSGRAYGFAARKKVGKTMLAGTISYNLAMHGVKHLFIAAEMGSKEIHQRLMARAMDVYPSAFRSDYARSPDFAIRFGNASRQFKNKIIYQDAPGLSFDDLKRFVTAAVHQHKVKGVILDYWQLVGGKPAKKNQTEHLDEVAQWIANSGRKMGFWSMVMGQINQEGNTRGGEGMRLAFDQVYQLHREDVSRPEAWLEMMDTRYTKWANIGSKEFPGLVMREKGPFFEEAA